MTQTPSTLSSLWSALIEPHAAIRARRERQRATFLAAASLILGVASLPPSVYALVAFGGTLGAIGLVQAGLLLVCYALSRTRYATWGAVALVIGQALLGFGVLASMQADLTTTSFVVAFMLIPVLLATLLLPARGAMALVAAINVALNVSAALRGQLADFYAPLILTAIVSTIAAVAAFLRERDLNTIEEQAERLARRSDTLESESGESSRAIMITSDIGRLMTGARDVDVMLKQVAQLIVERFDLYHAQVFLVDPTGKQARLRAAGGSAADELMAQGHSLQLSIPSVVTRAITKGEIVTVSDTDTDPIHRRNELMPLTRSEIGLPLRASGQVIGALNAQSVAPNHFKLADITVFQTIADQMAIAVENARLFERAQRDLEDIETLNRQLTGEAWRSYLTGRAGGPVGFASADGQISAIDSSDQPEGAPSEGTISLPLKVRGETIGVLDVTSRTGEAPDSETRSMLEAVAERVALALDSTRLGEQAQRQAQREQILSKISADLQATTDMNAILRIAARETSRAFGSNRSFVHLSMEYDKDSPA